EELPGAIVTEPAPASKAQRGRGNGGLGKVPDLGEALRDRQGGGRRVHRNNRARLLEVLLVPYAVIVGEHERIARVARLPERAMDLDRHRELPQQREEARAYALEEVGVVQRDEDAVRAAADEERTQLLRALRGIESAVREVDVEDADGLDRAADHLVDRRERSKVREAAHERACRGRDLDPLAVQEEHRARKQQPCARIEGEAEAGGAPREARGRKRARRRREVHVRLRFRQEAARELANLGRAPAHTRDRAGGVRLERGWDRARVARRRAARIAILAARIEPLMQEIEESRHELAIGRGTEADRPG